MNAIRVLRHGVVAAIAASVFFAGRAYASGCQLGGPTGKIQHIIYVQFDNTHFIRDNPNVPSDLEQMPHLLNFLENNGTLLTNDHTVLVSHTATGILSSLTGLYGDRMGVPVSNSFRYFNPNGTSNPGVSFAYWTDPIFDPSTSTPTDTTFNMLTEDGKNAPAPWVPYTRAGCNVGSVAAANTILENIAIDIPTVFGANSPQEQEVKSSPDLATADFVGIGVHCAQGSSLCSSANGGQSDKLPDEPGGGYTGFNALFGHKYIAPQINPTGPLTDLNGNVIKDQFGNAGFPGFDGMSAAVSLSYVAQMQEHNIPVTFAYISDAHDAHPNGPAFGPGQAGYVAALKAYDDAFSTFFTRLAKDGIDGSNTLFIFTVDEGDHFVGGAPSPANCDGVTTPCNYSQIGEVDVNFSGLLATQQSITTPFRVHSDSAPTVYITGNPARDNQTVTRPFERGVDALTAKNPITGVTDNLTLALADPVEMELLHMITADPARTPTFTLFGYPDYFFFTGAANCNSPCVQEEAGFAWNHGDATAQIAQTWVGLVGPGVLHLGEDGGVWSDHTDLRPTILELAGLTDDYTHDGRVIVEALDKSVLPRSQRLHGKTLVELGAVYKQINAPFGQLGHDTLMISTAALKSNDSGDATYNNLEGLIASWNVKRNSLVSQMETMLEAAAFEGQAIDEAQAKELIKQGDELLDTVNASAAGL